MIDIQPETQWIDKKDKALTVLAVDHDKDELVFSRPETPTVKRTVSIEVFTNNAKPASQQQSMPKVKPTKAGQYTFAIIDDLPINFGQSPNLQLSNQEWLERGMHAKTVKFNIGAGGEPPEVNWEDHCAAIAMIEDKSVKAMASILLWGNDANWDWSRHFDDVVHHLAATMVDRCNKDKRSAPKACKHSLLELARLMARMVLHFELYELWDIYTVKGRLQFSGIEVNASTYTNAWLTYQRQMTHDLFDMIGQIDIAISDYRRQLRYAN